MKQNMKRLMNAITVFSMVALCVMSCSKIQDIEKRLDTLESKVTALEIVLPGINENISSIQTLIDGGLLIREVKQTDQGVYVVVLSDGREIPLSSSTQVSDSHFASVSYKDELFTVTLKDGGKTISIPVVSTFLFNIVGTDGVQYFTSGQTKEYVVEKQGVANAVVTVPSGWIGILEGNTLKVTAPVQVKSFVADSRSDVSVIAVSSQGFSVVAKMKVEVGAEPTPDPTPEPGPDPVVYNIGDAVEGGVLFWISEDGTTGKVLYPSRGSINESSNIAWAATDIKDLSNIATSTVENLGSTNVELLKQTYGSLDKFPAAKWCDDIDGDWYLPARNELKLLFEAYNGTTWDNATYEKPNAITDAEKAARAAFDDCIRKLEGGYKLNSQSESNNGDEMWSSSLSSNGEPRAIRFGKRADNSYAPTEAKKVRCIKKVNL